MGDVKKFSGNKQRGGNPFNRGPGGRPSFGSGKPQFRGGDRGEREMFKATCTKCGKPCEVPFRPSGDRPVYCKDCFQAMGGPVAQNRGDRGGRDSRGPSQSFPKRDFAPRPYTPSQGSGEDKRLDDLKIQLATIISKLDKLLNILGNTSHSTLRAAQTNTKTLHDTIAGVTLTSTPKKKTTKGVAKAKPTHKNKPSAKKK